MKKQDSSLIVSFMIDTGYACQVLALALLFQNAVRDVAKLPTVEAACAVVRRRLSGVRFGVARGTLVVGALGAQRHRYHFFGGAAAEAARLAGVGGGGEILVQVRAGERAHTCRLTPYKFIGTRIATTLACLQKQ